MSMLDGDPFELIIDGKFSAAEDYLSQLIEQSESDVDLSNRAIARLNLGKLELALADFERAAELCFLERRERRDVDYIFPAVVHWIRGDWNASIETLCDALTGLRDGTIQYSDPLGGVEVAALLWFAAVSTEDHGDHRYAQRALAFITDRLNEASVEIWPSAIGRFLVGTLGQDDLIRCASDSSSELRKSRQLCSAYFYLGIAARSHSESVDSVRFLEKSVDHGARNKLDAEYYLSRHELTSHRCQV